MEVKGLMLCCFSTLFSFVYTRAIPYKSTANASIVSIHSFHIKYTITCHNTATSHAGIVHFLVFYKYSFILAKEQFTAKSCGHTLKTIPAVYRWGHIKRVKNQ